MTSPHKYHHHIKSLANCPPSICTSKNIEAFRFVFSDINAERNFLPTYIISPVRRNSASNEGACAGYGLSFFNTLDNARRKYLSIIRSHKNFSKNVGDCVAQGLLREEDGVMTDINEDGHFTLHEFEGTELRGRFTIVARI
jgi:hypothetical protein